MDKFPEAFRRFEEVVDVDRIQSFSQLRLVFASWAGQKWHGSNRQMNALAVEARKRGIPVVVEGRQVVQGRNDAYVSEGKAVTWRYETITVRGDSQDRYRDLKTGRFIKKP